MEFLVFLCTVQPLLVAASFDGKSVSNEEDRFARHFTPDPENYTSWEYAEKWSLEPSQQRLKRFCAVAHQISGRGYCKVNLVLYKMRWLSFAKTSHPNRRVDLLEYGCQEGLEPAHIEDYWMVTVDDRWYITEGVQWDCVFYLTRVNASVEFVIDEHVCGVKIYQLSYTLTNSLYHL